MLARFVIGQDETLNAYLFAETGFQAFAKICGP
jgi:hypothetical protein